MRAKLTLVALLSYCVVFSQVANRYDVVIDEIMTDPAPPAGLPDVEFIELKNTSTSTFNLNGWRVGDASSFATINVNFLLQPDSFVIICSNGAVASLSAFGTVLGVTSFPSLDNIGDELYLRSKEGRIIHAVAYNISWYHNPVKEQGGWSLEMKDTHNPCTGASNWAASTHVKGGTPGKKNAIDAANKDNDPPMLLRSFAAGNTNIILVFDEPLDSVAAATVAYYNIGNGIGQPITAVPIAPLYNKVQLKTSVPLLIDKVYDITVTGVTDCSNNAIGAYNHVKLGLASTADSFSLVINEMLFNPKPDGVDYIELYNRSDKIVDLKDCYLANRASNGTISSLKQLSTENRLLFPQEYLLVTEDAGAVQKQYLAKDPAAFITITAMPSYPDDKGTVVLLNTQGTILDEAAYDAHWHFKLIANEEGVALERINYHAPTQDANNWYSAAATAGYGTPGYQNSQFKKDNASAATIAIEPAIFSPDNDGLDDVATISYHFPQQGYVCNISIFDASGRPVRYLARNALCGLNGSFRWDGLDDKNSRLPIGVYVVYTEIFTLQGKTNRFKQAVTLARKL